MNVVFINTHPIQYFAPLYQRMAKLPDCDLSVIYLSDETIKGYKDAEFGVNVKWDIPLLQGYKSVFIKNNSWNPSIRNGFFGLVNLGLVTEMKKLSKGTLVIVHGWGYFSLIFAIVLAKSFGLKVGLRGESPLKHEIRRQSIGRVMRKFFLTNLFFPMIDFFFYIGRQNQAFYRSFGVSDKKLFFAPYSVDNNRFRKEFLQNVDYRATLRKSLNVPDDAFLILFAGKYVEKKRPMDLLSAMNRLREKNIFCIMMGEGELRPLMEKFIFDNALTGKVLLTGFVNQTEVSKYYAIADLFVMCSGIGETWGLVVNEAMNFEMPVLVSDLTGCSDDLVNEELNGHVFPTGDVDELVRYINLFVSKTPADRQRMGKLSLQIVSEYSFEKIIGSVQHAVSTTNGREKF
jgi:glycosyltransferase involved in cell wall biosynthesis